MIYIKKVSSKNNFYYILLPKRTSLVYIDINLKSGYVNENNKEYGIAHLLEHYLIGNIKKLDNFIEVGGSIWKEDMNYFLKSNKSRIINDAQIFIKSILKSQFLDENLFQREKEAVINELYVKMNKPDIFLEEIMLKERVKDKKCRYIRDIEKMIKNIKRVSLKDLRKYYQKFFVKKNLVITISGFQLDSNIIKKINYFISECNLPKGINKNAPPQCVYSEFRIKKLKKDIGKGIIAIILSFPIFNPQKIETSQRIKLNILSYLLSNSSDSFLNHLREEGIYNLSTEKILLRGLGIIYFSTRLKKQKFLSFLRVINRAIKELKSNEISKKKLNILLNQIKQSEKRAFNNNLERREWVNFDLLHYGKLVTLKEDLETIDRITPQSIKLMAQEIFKRDLVNIIIVGKEAQRKGIREIRKYLDF